MVGLALATLLIGCTGQIGSPKPSPYDGPKNVCERNRDCAAGSTCRQDLHFCVADADPAGREYVIKVTPNDGPSQTFAVTVDDAGRAEAGMACKIGCTG